MNKLWFIFTKKTFIHYYYYYYYYYYITIIIIIIITIIIIIILFIYLYTYTFLLCMMHDFVRHVSPTLYRIPTRVLFEELYMIKLIPHAMSSLDQYHP